MRKANKSIYCYPQFATTLLRRYDLTTKDRKKVTDGHALDSLIGEWSAMESNRPELRACFASLKFVAQNFRLNRQYLPMNL